MNRYLFSIYCKLGSIYSSLFPWGVKQTCSIKIWDLTVIYTHKTFQVYIPEEILIAFALRKSEEPTFHQNSHLSINTPSKSISWCITIITDTIDKALTESDQAFNRLSNT